MANKSNPNIKNLKPVRTKKEARERGRKGGIKSGETRRRQKSVKECVKMFAELTPTDKVVSQLENVGIPKESTNYLMAMVVGVGQKAMKGDPKAFKMINEFLGEDAKLNLDLEKHKEDMSLKEREYQLRLRELELKEKEFEHRVAIETGEVKEDEKVFIVNDIDEIPKETKDDNKKRSKTK